MARKKPTFEEASEKLEAIAGQNERVEIGTEEAVARDVGGMGR